ncbi:Ring finger domain [Carpediemonas membranifera]|uniref:Ring finger domain n=1 Tax=Carpediemonas membranifera TaxID=201153 RepID=A0A8J6DZI5_9EUKA|nr:Ring finger domain [Carpediemonas membranifera]|eukprot:KAG9393654.1 Ring finger domain [Carpediemonas membranifera]
MNLNLKSSRPRKSRPATVTSSKKPKPPVHEEEDEIAREKAAISGKAPQPKPEPETLPLTAVSDDHDASDRHLRDYKHSLSLAQTLGLVPRPPSPLNSSEWTGVKQTWRARGDMTCSICYEPLGKSEQVLLSCSHSFHMRCLKQVEIFSKKRTCPLCRAPYQARRVYDAEFSYIHDCAAKVQAVFRGYVVRKQYKALRRITRPSDPGRARIWVGERVEEFGDNVLSLVEDQRKIVDAMLGTVESAVREQESLFTRLETLQKIKRMSEDDWAGLLTSALGRHQACPICLRHVCGPGVQASVGIGSSSDVCMTSCGHLYHTKCLESLEAFEDGASSCPVCRQYYVRTAVLVS